jgi:hypothetical protein
VNHLPTPRAATDTAPTTDAHPRPHLVVVPPPTATMPADDEDGSLVAEYGLLAVVAATVSGVLITWSRSGALADFFGLLLDHARNLVIGG